MMAGKGSPETLLSKEDIRSIIAAGIPGRWVESKRVLVLTPDFGFLCATLIDLQERSALPPLPQVARGRVAWAGPRTLGILRWGGLELYDVEATEPDRGKPCWFDAWRRQKQRSADRRLPNRVAAISAWRDPMK